MRTITAAYLFPDGHCVTLHEKDIRLGSKNGHTRLEYAELWQQWSPAKLTFKGRLVFHRYQAAAFLRVLEIADSLTCKQPSLELGSENTRKRGIYYGGMTFELCCHSFSVPIYAAEPSLNGVFNGMCSEGYTYQPDIVETWDDVKGLDHWGHAKIAEVHPLPAPQPNRLAA